ELDAVEPAAFAVKGSEAGGGLVGEPPSVKSRGAAARGAERAEARHGMRGPLAGDRFHKRRVAGEEVDVPQGRALVEDFVGGERGGHGRLPGLIRASLSTAPRAREQPRRPGLAGRSESAYRGRFNDQSRSQSLLRAPAFADVREFVGWRDPSLARPRPQGPREQPAKTHEPRCTPRA